MVILPPSGKINKGTSAVQGIFGWIVGFFIIHHLFLWPLVPPNHLLSSFQKVTIGCSYVHWYVIYEQPLRINYCIVFQASVVLLLLVDCSCQRIRLMLAGAAVVTRFPGHRLLLPWFYPRPGHRTVWPPQLFVLYWSEELDDSMLSSSLFCIFWSFITDNWLWLLL